MPSRLTVIGDLERPDHFYLQPQHRCYFWGEYTPYEHTGGQRWAFSATNQLISNFKKGMERRGLSDWHYKAAEIARVARAFSQLWNWRRIQERRPMLVPMPPSKARTDPLFDPRMFEMLNSMARQADLALDIRDCLSFDGSANASHGTDERPSPEELYGCMSYDARTGRPAAQPGIIFLFDDMLTTGAHFLAAVRKLGDVYPGIEVIGSFIARRRLPSAADDFDVI